MNTSLIPVTLAVIGSQTVQTVDGRTLHTFLEVQSHFRSWINRRIEEYGFEEGKDFRAFLGESAGGRPNNEYALTLGMAKELSMVEKTAKGKQARQYFIECERRALEALPTTSPSTTDPRIIETAFSSWLNIAKLCGFEGNMAVLSADRGTQAITGVSPLTLMGATHLIADQRGKVYTPTELGQCLTPPISARKVNVLLESAGLQQRESGAWLPTSDAQGLFEWADTNKRRSCGAPVKQLRWFKTVLDRVVMLSDALTTATSLVSTHAIGGAQ